MDEALLRDKIREIILDNNYASFIELKAKDHNFILSYCVSLGEIDWLYNDKLINKVIRYVLSALDTDALDLAHEIKLALIDYYDVHLEELFDAVRADITAEINQDAGMQQYVDPTNGEVSWRR